MTKINEILIRIRSLQKKMARLRKEMQAAPKGEKFKYTLKIQETLEEFRELDNAMDFYGVWR